MSTLPVHEARPAATQVPVSTTKVCRRAAARTQQEFLWLR
jgi:hypothetical protein